MFVRTSKHVKWVEMAAESRARAMLLEKVRGRTEFDLRDARKEIQRLTNIIVSLKQQGHELNAEHTGPSWGSYRFDEIEAEQRRASSGEPRPEPEAGFYQDEETLLAEEDLRAELERVFQED